MLQKSVRSLSLTLLLAAAVACDSGTDPDDIVEPASIDLQALVDVILEGQTTQLQATVLDEEDDPIADADVEFTSSSQSIATVNDDGLVTGVGNGEVEITASAGDQSDVVALFIFDPGEDPCQTGLGLGSVPVRSSLQEGDCTGIFEDGSYVDLWFFDLEQQSDVTIEMTSDVLDTYVQLEDDELNVLDGNGAPGGDNDSSIQMTLEAGRYWILANHYPPEAGPQPEGVYTLSLTTTGAAADPAARLIAADAAVKAAASGRERVRQP